MNNGFTHTILGKTGLAVHRLGFSATYRPGRKTVRRAIDAGLNYFFCYGMDTQMLSILRELSPSERQRIVISSGVFKLGPLRPNLRRGLERRLRQLKTDYIDIFLMLGAMKLADFSDEIRSELENFREEGKVRFIGVSGHDRNLLGRWAAEGSVDVVMMRYNAAHRGAEQEIFPHLQKHNPGIVGYTATRWRYLLRRPKGWPKESRIPTAGECYRFVLSNSNVHVVLTAPSNIKQLNANFAALESGPLNPEEYDYLCKVGDAVRHKKKLFV